MAARAKPVLVAGPELNGEWTIHETRTAAAEAIHASTTTVTRLADNPKVFPLTAADLQYVAKRLNLPADGQPRALEGRVLDRDVLIHLPSFLQAGPRPRPPRRVFKPEQPPIWKAGIDTTLLHGVLPAYSRCVH